MSRFLMIDIGAGTMDMLCFDSSTGEHFKAVALSPVRLVAVQINHTEGPLVVTGGEMGGGPVSDALIARAKIDEVVMTPAAAATLHHDMEKVQGWGIKLAEDDRIREYLAEPAYTAITLGDIQSERIARIIAGLGLPMDFQVIAVCAQDHGVPPQGVSHLDFRHNLFVQHLSPEPDPARLLYPADRVPEAFNRLRFMAERAADLYADEVYVMDSGMAAILGASQDTRIETRRPFAVLDIATSHTVGAVMADQQLAGFFEYHTRDITLERLESLLRDFPEGRIDHNRILQEGGHGAFLHRTVPFVDIQTIIATGPKRGLMAGSRLPIAWGAPLGDNMMTGAVGLLEAVRRVKGLDPITYI